ncbi:hypothetical protein K443DRAFT_319997 [Laccaria amethystina LaAM-08-1]|jgi:hypothetical protein|uniref:Unplaced genomic scaffold K443scaffold_210, whole genome shotgun sequence n=1 Tax=Laccaria amethystina LaAM-08-1 TaxID=1095629 RepID=A0A0C9WK28_9AGAR|nr:hypothetical protein K443DRAFT_319997 [Laccaria amethystina LaAM-08-1]
MSGTGSWEVPGAVLSDTREVCSTLWIYSEYMCFIRIRLAFIAKRSSMIDVGGGMGSMSMLLASAFGKWVRISL